jgi:hypothetical protein
MTRWQCLRSLYRNWNRTCSRTTDTKRPALSGPFVGVGIMGSPKCLLPPIVDHSANLYWPLDPNLSPKLITFPVTTHSLDLTPFVAAVGNSPSVCSRWHCYASGGDKLPCSSINNLLTMLFNVIYESPSAVRIDSI